MACVLVLVSVLVRQISGRLLDGGVRWFLCGLPLRLRLWLLLFLLLYEVLCERGQKLGSVGADEEGGWVAAAADDELQEVGGECRGKEEGLLLWVGVHRDAVQLGTTSDSVIPD
jgi:hypothetical protein